MQWYPLEYNEPMATKIEKARASELSIADADSAALRARLRRLEGQIRAVTRMIEERADCHAIVQQMSAARGALDRAMVQLMVTSMTTCLTRGDGKVAEAELARLGETFAKLL